MYKFLTSPEAEKVRREYGLRRVGAGFELFVLSIFFAALTLLPSIIIANGRKNSAMLALNSSMPGKVIDRSELEGWVTNIKMELRTLAPDKMEKPYEYFQSILSAKPLGIKITDLHFQKLFGPPVIKVRGIAKDRQSLQLFKSNLNSSGNFGNADFPVDNLAKDVNIEFEISLSPKI